MAMLSDYYRTGYSDSMSRYSLFEKTAYGEDEHREIAQHALPAMAPGGAHPDIARRYLRGSTTIDTALRGTHPWLGGVSPSVAAQHSFRLAPGTAGRRVVGQNILQRHREGIDNLAKGMAASQPELIRQGLHTLGGANHTLADLSSHFERGLDTAPITQERSSPLGKAVNRVLPAQTAATLEQLIAHTTSSPDKITGDKLDRLAMRRAAGHGAAIRHQTIRRLVGAHGLSSVDAERLFDQHMASGVPSAPTRGGFSRGLQALEGAIAPDAIIDAARTPSKLPARLRSSAKNVGNLAAQYAAHVGETSPIARGANNLLRRLFQGGRRAAAPGTEFSRGAQAFRAQNII